MICFDIGASVGRWSRVNLNNYSKIIAIEAIPNIYNNLKQSLELCNHCECINYVVTNNNNQSINFYNCENYVLSTQLSYGIKKIRISILSLNAN